MAIEWDFFENGSVTKTEQKPQNGSVTKGWLSYDVGEQPFVVRTHRIGENGR